MPTREEQPTKPLPPPNGGEPPPQVPPELEKDN